TAFIPPEDGNDSLDEAEELKLSQLLLRKVGSEERHKHNQAHPLHVGMLL
ncbi:22447_t:CDS:1, partial [Gigaspora rosea]